MNDEPILLAELESLRAEIDRLNAVIAAKDAFTLQVGERLYLAAEVLAHRAEKRKEKT